MAEGKPSGISSEDPVRVTLTRNEWLSVLVALDRAQDPDEFLWFRIAQLKIRRALEEQRRAPRPS
jgi:hypothetical protein